MPKVDKVGIRVEYAGSSVIIMVKDGDSEIDRKVFDFDELPTEIQDQVSLYGLNKVLQDRTSDQKDKVMKLEAMDQVWSMLIDGQWKKEREGGFPTVRSEIEAIAEIKGVSVAAIQKALKGYTAEQKDKIFADPKVREKAAEIAAKRVETEVSLDTFL